MASPRHTPFIASLDSEDLLDATLPLGDIAAASPLANRAEHRWGSGYREDRARTSSRAASPAPATTWVTRLVIGMSGVLVVGALIWADRPSHSDAIARAARSPPPPIQAQLQSIPVKIEAAAPDITLPDQVEPHATQPSEPSSPPPNRTTSRPLDELAAALLERRKQMYERGIAGADVDAVAAIDFDPSRRSARVVYRLENSSGEVVEYWALHDGRWQAVGD